MRKDDSTDDELLQSMQRASMDVEPVIDPSRPQGYFYPFLEDEGLDPTSVEPLEALVARGELERKLKYKLRICPKDGSPHLRTALLCPSCQSEDISKEVLIEHFTCGYIAPEARFKAPDGLVCPKCGKRLKLLGKDHRKPSDFYRCGDCGEVTYIPEVHHHCTHCDEYFDTSEVSEKSLYSYFRRDEVPSALKEVLARAAQVLEGAGYEVAVLQKVEGRSGVKHACDLFAFKEVMGLRTEVLMDISLASKEVSSKPLVGLFGKGEDVGISNLLFVASPGLEESARGYARFHGIKVLEAEREKVLERLPDFLSEELFIGKETEQE